MIKMYVSQGPVQFRSLLLCFDICLRTPDSEDWNLMQSSEFCIFSMLVEYHPIGVALIDEWYFPRPTHSSLTVKAISKLEKLFACIYIDRASSQQPVQGRAGAKSSRSPGLISITRLLCPAPPTPNPWSVRLEWTVNSVCKWSGPITTSRYLNT